MPASSQLQPCPPTFLPQLTQYQPHIQQISSPNLNIAPQQLQKPLQHSFVPQPTPFLQHNAFPQHYPSLEQHPVSQQIPLPTTHQSAPQHISSPQHKSVPQHISGLQQPLPELLPSLQHVKTEKNLVMDFTKLLDEEIGLEEEEEGMKTGANKSTFCEVCSKDFSTLWSKVEHVEAVHELIRYSCDYCGNSASSKGNLRKHIIKHHPDESIPETFIKIKSESTSKYTEDVQETQKGAFKETNDPSLREACKLCSEVFKDRKLLLNHLKLHKTGNIRRAYKIPTEVTEETFASIVLNCPRCDKKFNSENILRRHKEKYCKIKDVFRANPKSQDGLNVDGEVVDAETAVMMLTLGYGGCKRPKLEENMDVKMDDRDDITDLNKEEAYERIQDKHMELAETDENIIMQSDSETKPFICKVCDIIYQSKLSLQNHNRYFHDRTDDLDEDNAPESTNMDEKVEKTYNEIEPGEKLVVCKICDRTYKSKLSLQNHKRFVHDGINYPCSECDFKGTAPSSLKYHIEGKHTTMKFPCNQCNYMSNTHQELAYHKKRQHIEGKDESSLYPCEECDQKFETIAGVKRHKARHTKNTEAGQENTNKVEEKDIKVEPTDTVIEQLKTKVEHLKTEFDHIDTKVQNIYHGKFLRDHDTNADKIDSKKCFECDQCGRPYGSLASLRTHKYMNHKRREETPTRGSQPQSIHPPSNVVKVKSELPNLFDAIEELLDVPKNISPPLEVKTEQMDFMNISAEEMNLLVEVDESEPTLNCPACDGKFKGTHGLSIHTKKMHSEDEVSEEVGHEFKQYQCLECGKQLNSERGFKLHTIKMHKKRVATYLGKSVTGPFICKICGQKFKGSIVLSSHYRKHPNAKAAVSERKENFISSAMKTELMDIIQDW